MSMFNYIADHGKETLAERVFVYTDPAQATATGSATLGILSNAGPTVFTDLEGLLTIDNSAVFNSGDNQWVMPLYIRMTATEDGDGTFFAISFSLDNVTRYASAGTTLQVVQTSYDTRDGYTDRTAKGKCSFGDLTLDAGSSEKWVAQHCIAAATPDGSPTAIAVGDVFTFQFGAQGEQSGWMGTVGTLVPTDPAMSTPVHHVYQEPPVWIGRQCALVMRLMSTATATAARWQIEVCTVELGHPREST